MLDTLYKYIEEQPGQKTLLDSLRHWLAVERRFAALLSISVVAHILFYAALIILDTWAMGQIRPLRRQPTEYAVITEIAPPPKYAPLRQSPESLERADTKRLQYDPETANDTDLLSRSLKPSSERGSSKPQTQTPADESQPRSPRGAGNGGAPNQPPNQSAPPVISSAQINRAPQPEAPFVTAAPSTQPATPPPAPSQKQGTGASNSQDTTQAAARRGDSDESNAFGPQQIQGQFMARVRAKVSRINEANMPHDWIATVLPDKVFAMFSLTVKRDGRIQHLELVRSSGYRRLDEQAREAIYIASPFEGYPQTAGETIILTVNVYYTPSR